MFGTYRQFSMRRERAAASAAVLLPRTVAPKAMLQKKKRPWTEEEDRRLIAMIEGERPRTSIAAALRRSLAAIKGRLRELRARERAAGAGPPGESQ